MNSEDNDHICEYIKGNVAEYTRRLVAYFTILWTIYEHDLYQQKHHLRRMPRVVDGLPFYDDWSYKINILHSRLVNYIKSKNHGIFDYDAVVKQFNISIKQHDDEPRKDILESELRGYIDGRDIKDKLKFMLVIATKVRNNMFHGKKEIRFLDSQQELFEICIETFKLVLDIDQE